LALLNKNILNRTQSDIQRRTHSDVLLVLQCTGSSSCARAKAKFTSSKIRMLKNSAIRCFDVLQCDAVCCSMMHSVAVCCGALHGANFISSKIRTLQDSHLSVCCSVLQCVAVCCSVLQCVAVCCSALQCAAVCWSVLECAGVCCSVLQCVAVRVLPCVAVCCSVLQCIAVCCNMLSCVAVCCSVLQCAVVCCIVLQCAAVGCTVKTSQKIEERFARPWSESCHTCVCVLSHTLQHTATHCNTLQHTCASVLNGSCTTCE